MGIGVIKLLGSSATIEGVINLISDYYYGSTITLDGENVYNKKGLIQGVRVRKSNGRYRFEAVYPLNS